MLIRLSKDLAVGSFLIILIQNVTGRITLVFHEVSLQDVLVSIDYKDRGGFQDMSKKGMPLD